MITFLDFFLKSYDILNESLLIVNRLKRREDMSTTKGMVLTLITYFLAIGSPVFLTNFLHLTSGSLWLSFSSYLIGTCLLLAFYLLTKNPHPSKPLTKNNVKNIFFYGLLGSLLSILAQLLGQLVYKLLVNSDVSPTNLSIQGSNWLLALITVLILTPIMEELVFRQALTTLITEFFPPWISGILSSAIFAVAHGNDFFIGYFLMGLSFYLIYRRSGSIWSAIISHMVMNLIVLLFSLN